jgi:phage shock protein PspC (stress-responsive transcriptional regulator)
VDVTLVRIIWLLVVLFGGTGLVAYVVAWIAMPKENEPAAAWA